MPRAMNELAVISCAPRVTHFGQVLFICHQDVVFKSNNNVPVCPEFEVVCDHSRLVLLCSLSIMSLKRPYLDLIVVCSPLFQTAEVP